MANDKDRKPPIGSLWKGLTRTSEEYVRGVIKVDGKEVNFVGWLNRSPQSDRSPTFFLHESEPRQASPNTGAKPQNKPAPKPQPKPAPAAPEPEDPPI